MTRSWSAAVRDSPSNADIRWRWIWLCFFVFAFAGLFWLYAGLMTRYPSDSDWWGQIFVLPLIAALVMIGVTAARLREARVLQNFSLTADISGLQWTGKRGERVGWEELGHVFVSGAKGKQRLWAVRPGHWTPDPRRSAFMSALMRMLGFERLLLDVPIAALNVSAAEVTRGIENASGGRFPDYPPRPWGGENDEVRG